MGFLSNLINKTFESYRENRIKELKNDPKLKKLVDDAAKDMEAIEKHIEENVLDNLEPAVKAYYDKLGK
tara:strand:+ start:203 stop:409 length:207 start_codon:yes stop_codon:yes gene_type:complete